MTRQLLSVFISLIFTLGFVACNQDDDFTSPSDSSTGDSSLTGAEEGTSGLPTDVLTAAGATSGTLDFTGAYQTTDWLTINGGAFALNSNVEAAKLDLFDTQGEGTYQVTLPVANSSSLDSVFEADITVTAGSSADAPSADSAYQIARAYTGDIDGDGADDTLAYAVIVVPGVYYAADGTDSSAHTIAALLLGPNALDGTIYNSTTVINGTSYTGFSNYFGTTSGYTAPDSDPQTFLESLTTGASTIAPVSYGFSAIAEVLDGTPMVAIARRIELSSQTDSATGARTDSGTSVQIVPIALVNNTTLPADSAPTYEYGDLAWPACVGLSSGDSTNPTTGSCTTGGATNAEIVQGITTVLTSGASYVAGNTSKDGVTGNTTGLVLLDSTTTRTHSIKIEFSIDSDSLAGKLMETKVTLTDYQSREVIITSTDAIATVVPDDSGADVNSQNLTQAICNGDTDITTAYGSDFTVDPYYFSAQNVFGSGETCQQSAVPATVLSDGESLTDKMYATSANGYAVTLGYVVGAALNPTLSAEQAATTFGNVVTAAGGSSPTVQNIVLSIPE